MRWTDVLVLTALVGLSVGVVILAVLGVESLARGGACW